MEMRENGVEEIGLFYLGESFLVPWLEEAISYAKYECEYPYVFLTTNGRLSTPDRVRGCIEAGLDSLKFSFNNSDPQQFKEITGVKPSTWHDIIANIKGAKTIRDKIFQATGHKCGIYASSILYDGDQQKKMEKAVERIIDDVDQHYYLPLYNQGALTTDVSEERGYVPTAGNQGRIGALRKAVPCWSAFTEGHITWDGHLSACCFDHSADWQMGNLNQMTFLEAWNSFSFQKLRSAHIKEELKGTPCEQCVAYS
jgi:radical SAM protein with 4Fe4S-binding SPASM domain